MENSEFAPIVLDNGSGQIKAGFALEDTPTCVFPSIVGRPKASQDDVIPGSAADADTLYIGDRALASSGILKISYPIESGIVTNWQDMQAVWKYTFDNQLRVDPGNYKVLLTEAPRNPRQNRQQMVEIMFDEFQVDSCYVQTQAILALYSQGLVTGCIFDSGDGVSHTIPIYEGFILNQAIMRLNLAGRSITNYLKELLMEENWHAETSSQLQHVRRMKEQHAYVALDYEEELKKAESSSELKEEYELPDGSVVSMNKCRFCCAEALFKPHLVHKEDVGIHEQIFQAIGRTEFDIRPALYKNIILSGGTTMFKNIEVRLEREITNLAPASAKVRVDAPRDRRFAVWLGGAVMAGLESFNNSWITKADFEECGPSIVAAKCST
eukprot:TRINITY_DN3234_c0_g1_i1.p2 TRINITY_DN3234_c0_g1~~TRINITY_DN3234_c0_g1_i1.p2  ORF type:complete len:393 (+),score=120.98 TRINITY_DN3234_c0_g1_i1:36-1181(+)